MQLFAAALALSSTLFGTSFVNADQGCLGGVYGDKTTTKLDIMDSVVRENSLHKIGGQLRYENIGTVRDRPVSLVVTVVDGDYADIAQVWIDRKRGSPYQMNGKKEGGKFANINLQTVEGKPKSGEGNFRMCFVDTETNELTTVEKFSWTVYDLDERGKDKINKPVIKEKLIIDTKQARAFQLWPNEAQSEVKLSCEDGSQLPCNSGVRTVFHSSTDGTGDDNPTDPNSLTDLQKSRSVTFTFIDTDCWEFTYDHYCPVEQPEYDGPSPRKTCKKYTGGNFLFAGASEEIINDGECLTSPPSPTASPTPVPTAEPTTSPTPSPTANPTGSPTVSPTASPTAGPSSRPTVPPTASPTTSPTAGPTSGPTTSPSSSPTAAVDLPTTLSPTESPTSFDTAFPTKFENSDFPTASTTSFDTASPTSLDTVAPTVFPTILESEGPTALPTTSPTTSPTKSPTPLPTVGATESPTASPTASPTEPPTAKATESPTTSSPTDAPTFTEDEASCPGDVTLIKKNGITDIPLENAIKIVNQDKSTVTVELHQSWTSGTKRESVDSIFYSFRTSIFDQKCYESRDVGSQRYDTIELTCEVLKPIAFVEICVVDEASHGILVPGEGNDNATVPKCCHPEEISPEVPVVCYTVEIKCQTECVEEIERGRRGLRGSYP